MTNIAMVKPWPIEIDGLPMKNGWIFHGKLRQVSAVTPFADIVDVRLPEAFWRSMSMMWIGVDPPIGWGFFTWFKRLTGG